MSQIETSMQGYLKEHPEIMAEIEQAILEKAGLSKPGAETPQ